jgi:polar amino acid transport system substrate-binding protein
MSVRRSAAAFLVSFCVSIASSLEVRADAPLVFGVLSVPPFAIGDDGKPPSGLYVELLGAIIEHGKIDARIELFPLARVITNLDTGSIAGTLAIPNPAILKLGVSAGEVMSLRNVMIGAKDAKLSAFDDLFGKNVCLLRGSSFDQRLNEEVEIRKTEVADYATCFRMLSAGRVDAMAGPKVGVSWNAKIGNIRLGEFGEPFVLNQRPVHLLVSKKSATSALLTAIAEGIQRARDDGSIAAITRKFAD